ncbi:hypothetical protein L1887_40856 [Cichorium endivia]|nr:hypothetical protein L1887_40856 [Cichorium endivia]
MSDSLVRVSRRAEWGAHRPVPGARRYIVETARAANHDRRDGISTSLSTARALAAAPVHAPSRLADRLSPFHIRPGRIAGPHSLPSRQFQALFDSLFKVLFIFPSRYLFAIGLTPVFSLGRNLPPYWGCIPKQPDSQTAPRGATGSEHDGALTLSGAPFQGTWARSAAEDASPDYNSDSEAVRFSSWADPGSLAVTKGILTNLRPDAMCPDKGCMVGGDAMRDAQAGVPSAGWLWAQLAFKNSMVHGILQFTPTGITAAAGTRLALQWILVKGFRLYSFQLPDSFEPGIVIYCHYLPVSGLGNLRACCLPWMW